MKRFWIDFAVGVFVIIGILSLIFIAFRVGNLTVTSSRESYNITAEFENIGSIRVGSPIKSAGILVGSVSQVGLDNDKYKALLTLNLFTDYQFPTDSQIAIFTTGLLGEQYVAISPGIEEEMLIDGDKAEYTQSAVIIEKLIGQAMLSLTNQDK